MGVNMSVKLSKNSVIQSPNRRDWNLDLPNVKEEKKPKPDTLLEHLKEQTQNKDTMLENIINKFRSGQKLTPAEMQYLARENPAMYEKIRRSMEEQANLERQMELAKTKDEARKTAMSAMANVEKTSEDAWDMFARTNHLKRVVIKYTTSAEFREKPDNEAELKELIQEEFKRLTGSYEGTLDTEASKEQSMTEQFFREDGEWVELSAQEEKEERSEAAKPENEKELYPKKKRKNKTSDTYRRNQVLHVDLPIEEKQKLYKKVRALYTKEVGVPQDRGGAKEEIQGNFNAYS